MNLEFKRAIRNNFYIFFSLVNILNVVLGYILLVSIDGIKNSSFEQFFESVYTVYTQFGVLIFSVFIIMQFYIDYKEKNIYFYRKLGHTSIHYFLSKIGMIFIATIMGNLIVSFIMCISYSCLDKLSIVFFKIESVMIYYVLVASTLGFIFKNFLTAFFVNIFLWILGIVLSYISSLTKYFAYYDASNSNYKKFISCLEGKYGNIELLQNIGNGYLYDGILFLLCLLIICCLSRRWMKNGV